MDRVYLVVEHNYEGYYVLHVFSDSTEAKSKMLEYINAKRKEVLANSKRYFEGALDPKCTFNYDILEFVLE